MIRNEGLQTQLLLEFPWMKLLLMSLYCTKHNTKVSVRTSCYTFWRRSCTIYSNVNWALSQYPSWLWNACHLLLYSVSQDCNILRYLMWKCLHLTANYSSFFSFFLNLYLLLYLNSVCSKKMSSVPVPFLCLFEIFRPWWTWPIIHCK